MDLATKAWRPLTRDAYADHAPSFIDDGRAVLFHSVRTPRGVYRIPTDGSQPARLVFTSNGPAAVS